jgi:hypothetical protein
MDPSAEAFDATAFTRNRPRLDAFGLTAAFFGGTVKRALKEGPVGGRFIRQRQVENKNKASELREGRFLAANRGFAAAC